MKKVLSIVLIIFMTLSLVACGSGNGGSSDDKKIALLVPFIGDQSYFDVVYKGLTEIDKLPNTAVTLIEMGTDTSKWENYYTEACEGGYDLVIGGNWEAEGFLYAAAEKYPDQKFINFDYSTPNTFSNVYAMMYKADELGYAAGIVAALLSETGIIGGIGGMDFDGINDFLGGYIQGAQAARPDIKVIVGYVGNFSDAAKAKEQAENIYKAGADVIFHAAGGAGNGLFEAAKDQNKYAIGVDSDQSLVFADRPEIASRIVTSGTKNVDLAMVNAYKAYLDGSIAWGTSNPLGLKENGVGLAITEQYKTLLTAEQQAEVTRILDEVITGKVAVKSMLGAADLWKSLRDGAAPK